MYVGNDIVAYKHLRCINKWKDKRFLQKILVPTEMEQLALQVNKDAYLWTLWTLKEAAYKLSCFLGNRNKFHPIQFATNATILITDTEIKNTATLLTSENANTFHTYLTTVTFNDALFYGATGITHQYVHSLVSNNHKFDKAIWAIDKHTNYNKNDYSTEVRHFTTHQLAQQHIIIDSIHKDEDGIPYVTTNNEHKQYISLSHDQAFIAYAFVMPY